MLLTILQGIQCIGSLSVDVSSSCLDYATIVTVHCGGCVANKRNEYLKIINSIIAYHFALANSLVVLKRLADQSLDRVLLGRTIGITTKIETLPLEKKE